MPINSSAIKDPSRAAFVVEGNTRMINRGGAMLYQPLDARAGQRDNHDATTRWVYITFRIARTVRPGDKNLIPLLKASQD